jgi:hypothetical protein
MKNFKGSSTMANKYMKKCSTSLATNEIQIKTTLRFHLILVRIATIKNTKDNKCWQGCSKTGTLIHHWWKCKLIIHYGKQYVDSLKLKIEVPCDPMIPLLGIYWMECKSEYNRDICTPMFIATLFTIAKLWKQSRCPITDEWIKNLWFIYTVQYFFSHKEECNYVF